VAITGGCSEAVSFCGEMDALENAGRQPAHIYRDCTIYTTLSPCAMCSGAILLYGLPRVVVGENRTFRGEEDLLRSVGWRWKCFRTLVDVLTRAAIVKVITT